MTQTQDEADLDGGPRDRSPERTCIVTRAKAPPGALLRFVRGPDGTLVPDIRARLPGRGVWVTPRADILVKAMRGRLFARALKAEVAVPDDLVEAVDRALEQDALQALALANKAGLVVTGAAKIESALGDRPLAAIVHARDGADDGRRKLDAAIRRRLGASAAAVEAIQIFASSQLDLALGRTNVIHAALAGGTASDGFVSRSRRLGGFREDAAVAVAASKRSTEQVGTSCRGAGLGTE